MTNPAWIAMSRHAGTALATVKNRYCAPPAYRPAAPVAGQMTCPACGSRLNYSVRTDGLTNGRCVAARCVTWSLQ